MRCGVYYEIKQHFPQTTESEKISGCGYLTSDLMTQMTSSRSYDTNVFESLLIPC